MSDYHDDPPSPSLACRASESLQCNIEDDPLYQFILADFREVGVPSLFSPPCGNNVSFFGDYQQSTSINSVYVLPTSNSSQPSSQERSEQQKQIQVGQPDGSKSGKIRIKAGPRSKFRPRTKKESEQSAHYLRSEGNTQPGHPSIHLEESWRHPKSIIEVKLLDKDGEPHPYTIDNKERMKSPLIFKNDDVVNTLYFHLTDDDFKNKEKIFLIEFIKAKQDEIITKKLIKTRQLDQSKLCFTRFYELPDGSYQPDEASVAYSCIMTEDYGDLTVEDVFPLYGPMCGGQKVCIESKGCLPKDLKTDLAVTLTGTETNWHHEIRNVEKNRNNFIFTIPPYPYLGNTRAKVILRVHYKDDIIYESIYMFTGRLDEELNSGNTTDRIPVYISTENIQGTKRPRQ